MPNKRIIYLNGKYIPIDQAQISVLDRGFLTSSTREIYPIIKLDNQIVGSGVPGPMWKKMMELYHRHLDAVLKEAS